MRGAMPCLSADLTTRAELTRIKTYMAQKPMLRLEVGARALRRTKLCTLHVHCSSLTPAGVVWSSLRRAAAGEGAEAQDLQPVEALGACRVGEGAGARGLQSGVVAICSSARVGVGEGAEACSFVNFGRPWALLGSSVAFGSGCG